MDVVLLRKLSWKSTLDFGKYSGQTVRNVFELNHTRYLRWCYYNLSNISFVDEVLEAIHIFEYERIKKPGTDPEKYDKINKTIFAKMINKDPMSVLKMKSRYNKVKRGEICADKRCRNKSYFKKSILMSKNHGHSK